jgi:hypothetical protein
MRLRFVVAILIICFTWDDKTTHKDISQVAAYKSILGTTNYLKNVGLAEGLTHLLKLNMKEKELYKWIQEGAELEDMSDRGFPIFGTTRSLNHFHNPLKPWPQAGLDDWYINHYTGESSLLWAQDGNRQNNVVEGDWSWQKTREYYYLAFTSKTDSERQANFAKTFRGLGHQMHLLQDTAVPDHVRNDAHPEDSIFGKNRLNGSAYFETWAKENTSYINSLASNAEDFLPDVSLNVSYDNLVPITQFCDTNRYTIENPSQFFVNNLATSLTVGLAEYTNANFFSGDTIFAAERYSTDDRHYFPYPRKSSTDLQAYIAQIKPLLVQIAEDGIGDKGIWIKKEGDGEKIEHFVRTSRWTGKIYKTFGEGSLFYSSFYRDDECHKDYTAKLIPRAVGYSAGLLNYFFRGEMDMIPDDAIGSGYVIVNNTDENMSGTFELWYDNKDDQRIRAWSSSLSIDKKSSGNNKSTNIKLILPSDTKEDGKYILVFRGRLGSEEDAVVGKNIEFKEEEYLFLLNVDYEISTFRIGINNGQYQLTPESKNININIDFDSFNLTIQSNPAKTEHYAAMPARYQDFITQYGLYRYGYTDYLGYNHYLSDGSPKCYRPKDFAEGSPYILGSENATTVTGNGDGIYASGRKNYTLDTNGKMTSYWNSIWRRSVPGQNPQYYFRYKDQIGGEWIDGNILPNQLKPIAVIDRNKAITISTTNDETISTTDETLSATLHTVAVTTGMRCPFSGETVTRTLTSDYEKSVLSQGISGDQDIISNKLKLGDGTLEDCIYRMGTTSDGHPDFYSIGWKTVSQNVNYSTTCRDGNLPDCLSGGCSTTTTRDYKDYGVKKGFFPDPLCDYCGDMQYVEYEETGKGESIKQVIDYDNKDADKTFIVFYMKSVTDDKKWGKISFWGPNHSSPLEQHKDQSYTTEYIMSYRIDGLSVSKIKITANNHRIIESMTATSYDPSNNSFVYNNYIPPDDEFNPLGGNPYGTETWDGQRITGVSCQINDRNMVYTYIIEKWADNKWVFDRRIVGIINISDNSLPIGYRQEFELDFSGMNFNPVLLSAIGVTK